MYTKLKFSSKNIHLYFGLISSVHTWKDWGNIFRIGLLNRKQKNFCKNKQKSSTQILSLKNWDCSSIDSTVACGLVSSEKLEGLCCCILSSGVHKTKASEKMWAKTADIAKEWVFPVFCAYVTIFEILRDTKTLKNKQSVSVFQDWWVQIVFEIHRLCSLRLWTSFRLELSIAWTSFAITDRKKFKLWSFRKSNSFYIDAKIVIKPYLLLF